MKLKKELQTGVYDRVDKHSEKDVINKIEDLKKYLRNTNVEFKKESRITRFKRYRRRL